MREAFKVDLPDEYLQEIGHVAVTWSQLESILDLCLMKLCGKSIHEPISWIPFAHMTYPLKMDVLSSLINELKPIHPGLKRFPDVKKHLTAAQQQRNKIIHSKWAINPDTGRVERAGLTARGKLRTEVRAVDLQELKNATKIIGKAAGELYRLVISSNADPTSRPHLKIDPA